MDCRKARYFLIASFDGELDGDTRKALSYHLKDCKKCRHEAFYYRELFSAKENLPELAPSTEFNEKLVATIRLREAQAAWPKPADSKRRARKWQFALVPPVFVAAAAAAFLIFTSGPVSDQNQTPAEVASNAAQPAESVAPAATHTGIDTPRYNPYGSIQFVQTQPAVIIPRTSRPALLDHPFASQLEQLVTSQLQQDPLAAYRARQRTLYVLPKVTNAKPKEQIY